MAQFKKEGIKLHYFKRILCVLFVFVFVFVLAVPVSATSTNEPELVALDDYKMQSRGCSVPRKVTHYLRDCEVPLFNQLDYPDTPYGDYGTIASHGCGITALAMVATYFKGPGYTPDVMADMFGSYNTEHGSYLSLFADSAEVLDLDLQERTKSWKKVYEALENGQVVISLQRKGLFTRGGHFIVLTGLTEDGRITVNDPYGANYNKNDELRTGFAEGFTEKQIKTSGYAYWIYGKKPIKMFGKSLPWTEGGVLAHMPAVGEVYVPMLQPSVGVVSSQLFTDNRDTRMTQ